MARTTVAIDLDALEAYTARLGRAFTSKEVALIHRTFAMRMAVLIRQEALPEIRAATPIRTGKLRRSFRVRARGGRAIEIYRRDPVPYWHLQTASGGGPLPRFIDDVALAVVDRHTHSLLDEIVTEVIDNAE